MHIVDLRLISENQINQLIERALEIKKQGVVAVKQPQIIAHLFFESSTRTHYSFEVASMKLGHQVLDVQTNSSSITKGETLIDTIDTLSAMNIGACIIRHPDNAFYQPLLNLGVPIINAGDGTGNHPSQSLLDLMSIKEHFGYLKGIKIMMIGDVVHSRVAHTNIEVMQRMGMDVHVCGFYDQTYESIALGIDQLNSMDVVMFLRVQHERHKTALFESKELYHQAYGLTRERLNTLNKTTIIMHPGPYNRGVELCDEAVSHPQSKIKTQVENGVYMRMAMLEEVLK